MCLTIRMADRADISGILNVYETYIIETPITFEYDIPTLEEFTFRFERICSQFPWLVCEDEEKIIGYAYADLPFERAAYQWNADIAVYIDVDYQRRGIATAFYNILEELLFRQGYYKIYTCITGINKGSLLLHQTLGYRETAVFYNSGFKMGQWLDVVWYEKNIREPFGVPISPKAVSFISEEKIREIIKKNIK